MYPHSWSADHERGSCTQGSLRLVAASASTEGFSPLRSFSPSGLPQDGEDAGRRGPVSAWSGAIMSRWP
jgi:hypothetical protein